jgi:hypothetical protein
MKGFLKGLGIGMGIYGVALTFSLGVVYGIKAQQRAEEGELTPADRMLFDSVDTLDNSVDQLKEAFG